MYPLFHFPNRKSFNNTLKNIKMKKHWWWKCLFITWYLQALWWRFHLLGFIAVLLHRTHTSFNVLNCLVLTRWAKTAQQKRRSSFIYCRSWKVCLGWHKELHNISCLVMMAVKTLLSSIRLVLSYFLNLISSTLQTSSSPSSYHASFLLCFLDLQLQEDGLIRGHVKLLQMRLRSSLTICNPK